MMGLRTNTAVWIEKEKRWRIKVQKDGKRRTFSSSTSGKKGQREANAKADAWLDENIEKDNMSLSEIYKEFIESQKKTTSKSHWFKYDSFGRNWIVPKKGRKKIGKITEQDIQDIIDDAFSEGGLSKKTLQNLRACLMAFLLFCRKNNATKLVAENLTISSQAKKSEKSIMQPNDMAKLFILDKTTLYCKEVKDRYIYAYRLLVLTGLRPGELMGLKVRDIVDDIVYIRRSINVYNEVTGGKNDNAKRHFALTSWAKSVLSGQMALRKIMGEDSEYLFGEMNLSSFSKRWRIYCEYNKIPYVTLYELRHTFVSVAKKLSLDKLKKLAGHAEDMDTLGIYGHEIDGELGETADELSGIYDAILLTKIAEEKNKMGISLS